MDQPQLNSAAVTLRAGNLRFKAKVKVTNAGLLAVGGLVSSILISTTALVWVATGVARRRTGSIGAPHRR